jgi:hypothetical protein
LHLYCMPPDGVDLRNTVDQRRSGIGPGLDWPGDGLSAEAFAIRTLAGAGAIPPDFAHRALTDAARQMPDHDPRRPWRPREIEAKITRAFDDGTRRPREARRA